MYKCTYSAESIFLENLPWIWEGVIAAKVIAGLGIVVVDEVWMHVVHPIVHDGGGHVEPGDTLGPGSLHVEVQPDLASILTSVLQVPLVGK